MRCDRSPAYGRSGRGGARGVGWASWIAAVLGTAVVAALPWAAAPPAGASPVGPLAPSPSYQITFVAENLPNGTAWSLTVLGMVHNTSTAQLAVSLPNGTYSYSAYSAYPPPSDRFANGTVVVDGAPESVEVAWLPAPSAGPAGGGPMLATPYAPILIPLAVGLVVLAVGATAAALVARRRPIAHPSDDKVPRTRRDPRSSSPAPGPNPPQPQGSDPLGHML